MLIPSTITALRTRRYTSTLYIHHTIHGFGYNPMNDGGRYSIQSPFVSNLPPAWSTLPPPITPGVPGRCRPGLAALPGHREAMGRTASGGEILRRAQNRHAVEPEGLLIPGLPVSGCRSYLGRVIVNFT